MEKKFAYVVALLLFVVVIWPIAVLNWRFWTRITRSNYQPDKDPQVAEAVDAIRRPSRAFLAFLLFPCLAFIAVCALLILEAMRTGVVGSAHYSRTADPAQFWLHLAYPVTFLVVGIGIFSRLTVSLASKRTHPSGKRK